MAVAMAMGLTVVRKEQDIRFLSRAAQIKTLSGHETNHACWDPR